MENIDIKERKDFIEQYVRLRNSYAELLLTSPVSITETKEWFKKKDVEVRGLAQDDTLLGVVILYLSRDGEIAFFVKDRNKGVGSKLLDIIEEIARERGLKAVWAWVLKDNLIVQRTFEKNGYLREKNSEREYKGTIRQGIKFIKYI